MVVGGRLAAGLRRLGGSFRSAGAGGSSSGLLPGMALVRLLLLRSRLRLAVGGRLAAGLRRLGGSFRSGSGGGSSSSLLPGIALVRLLLLRSRLRLAVGGSLAAGLPQLGGSFRSASAGGSSNSGSSSRRSSSSRRGSSSRRSSRLNSTSGSSRGLPFSFLVHLFLLSRAARSAATRASSASLSRKQDCFPPAALNYHVFLSRRAPMQLLKAWSRNSQAIGAGLRLQLSTFAMVRAGRRLQVRNAVWHVDRGKRPVDGPTTRVGGRRVGPWAWARGGNEQKNSFLN